MTDRKDLLIEIGTEELPPAALLHLSDAFSENMQKGLNEAELAFEAVRSFATPRRLAILVLQLATHQADKHTVKRGPAVSAAYTKEGKPSKAAEGFARSCGVTVAELDTIKTDKGEWLGMEVHEPGKSTEELIPPIAENALYRLPVPKRMRWGEGTVEFVRPVHWAVALFGETVIPFTLFDQQTGRETCGHRFHYPKAISLDDPSQYLTKLQSPGYVLADFSERRQEIENQVLAVAKKCGAFAIMDAALLDEVTGLVEWPVAITGSFAETFLSLPAEVLIACMQDQQKYFPLKDTEGKLLNRFIAIANIDSSEPEMVRTGNERVIHPRLSDARFFWQRDTKQPLANYQKELAGIIYQEQLGTLADKSGRLVKLATYLATTLDLNQELAERAARLSKCDLVTEMVGEFPELQGIMGHYYAIESGEENEVAKAIEEQYYPRFAGDQLPDTGTGQILSLADKLDTMAGIFSIGQQPTGDKDPFALRRAALGVIRIMIERQLPLNLFEAIHQAFNAYDGKIAAETQTDLEEFIFDRMRGYCTSLEFTSNEIEAVLTLKPVRLDIIPALLDAVRAYNSLPEAPNLSAANKRIANILKKANAVPDQFSNDMLIEDAEIKLAEEFQKIAPEINKLHEKQEYTAMLQKLAVLKDPVDQFFDNVMVMSEDESLQTNRIGLLKALHKLMNRVADLSRLAI